MVVNKKEVKYIQKYSSLGQELLSESSAVCVYV